MALTIECNKCGYSIETSSFEEIKWCPVCNPDKFPKAMENDINDPNSWWHKQEVIPCSEVGGIPGTVKMKKENGTLMFVDDEGNDITDNIILSYHGGSVMTGKVFIKQLLASE